MMKSKAVIVPKIRIVVTSLPTEVLAMLSFLTYMVVTGVFVL